MSAAPIENDNNPNYSSDNTINKKRQIHTSHAKTQKQRPASSDFNPQKVNSVLQSIHNSVPDEDDVANYSPNGTPVTSKHSENFTPLNPYDFPPKPVSVGGERVKTTEGMKNMSKEDTDNLVPMPVDNEEMDLQNLDSNYMNDSQVRDYYRKLVPNYNHSNYSKSENNKNYYGSVSTKNTSNSYTSDSNEVLIEKLNYMINLLEEQQDQKTDSVTEEVVLYSFLGVFIIFIVDSFTKVGKYVR